MASGIPTAQPTMRPTLFFFEGGGEGEGEGVAVGEVIWVTVWTMVLGPSVPVDTEVERDVSVLAGADGVSVVDWESLVAEAELEGAVDDGEVPPLPLAKPVIVSRVGALDAVFPPIVAYAWGSCSAKKGRGVGCLLQQSTSFLLASQHH